MNSRLLLLRSSCACPDAWFRSSPPMRFSMSSDEVVLGESVALEGTDPEILLGMDGDTPIFCDMDPERLPLWSSLRT